MLLAAGETDLRLDAKSSSTALSRLCWNVARPNSLAEMDFEEPEGPVIYTCPMHPAVVNGRGQPHHHTGELPSGSYSIAKAGMRTTPSNWTFRVGDWVKIEFVNETDSDHPMHHPFHVHGRTVPSTRS